MEDLVPVTRQLIGGEEVFAVNARDLHRFLEVGKDFSTWIRDRIAKYGLIEGQDYVCIESLSSPESGSSKARPQRIVEYILTLDMAKEVAMVERNERGRQVRRYFIACEKRLLSMARQPVISPIEAALKGLDRDTVVKDFEFLVRMQRFIPGMTENQVFLSAAAHFELKTGIDARAIFSHHAFALPSPFQGETEMIPSDIARQFGIVCKTGREDANAVNRILAELGFQKDTKSRKMKWVPTEKGWKFAHTKDVSRFSVSSGQPVLQVYWRSSILEVQELRDALDRKGRERQARLALSRDRGQSALDLH
ncbi:antA/AntB antirepressor family protein [Acidithiobacillus caldus]